jgi:hypothetical protein
MSRATDRRPLACRLAAVGAGAAAIAIAAPASSQAAQTATREVDSPKVRLAAAEAYPWPARIASARRWARSRGRVSFAVVDEQGRLRAVAGQRRYLSASLVKAMMLVAYLDRARGRALTGAERARLGPMIRRSDNDAATWAYRRLGAAGLRRVARRAGMTRFSTSPSWGSCRMTAADQARFFVQIDRLVPARHRPYARSLLAGIVSSQRWGIPRAAPDGFLAFFKGGWRPRGDWTVNQAALLEHGSRRFSVAVLSSRNGTFGRGVETVRGVAARLLRGYERY